ncbi:MAG: anaerobic ribonucleoside-triphosphate reductase [Promethearchaeota archaeon]
MVSSDNTRLMEEILPEVRTSRMDVESFDSGKIINSLIRETGINRDAAEKVTKTVLKRIIQSNVQWLSGPQIREMCCSVLAEIGLLEARKRYTRIGMPLMDYDALLTQGIKENANQYNNPESIHSWAADKISAEYALLRLLKEEQSKAHLQGDLHIHMLRYFDLRPFCVDGSTKIPIIKNNSLVNVEAKEFDRFFINDDESYINISHENMFLMTPGGPRRLKFVTRKKADPIMYKINTNKGKEIILSKEHRVMIFHEINSKPKEVQVKNLRKNDRLKIIDSTLIRGSLDEINLIDYLVEMCPIDYLKTIYVRNLRIPLIEAKNEFSFSWNELFHQAQILEYQRSWERGNIPLIQAIQLIEKYSIDIHGLELGIEGSPYTCPVTLKLSNDLLRLVGYFVADGNYNIQENQNYNLIITNKNLDILEDIESCIKNSFSTYITRCFYEDKTPQIYFGGKLIYLIFRYIFGIEPGNENKSLSNIFYNISNSKLKSLLTGLYSADGHVVYRPEKSDCQVIYTSKSKSLIDFLNLILSMHSIYHSIKKEKYTIDIPSYYKGDMQYRIKIHGYRNIKRLSLIMGFKQLEKQKKIKDYLRNHHDRTSIPNPSFELIQEIISIQPTHPYMYDFSLEGNGTWEQHTFYAENILIHNCQEWDLRMILKYGLPPCGWRHSAVSTPANHAMVAILHAAKWLGIVQGEFSLPYWEKVLIEKDGILHWRSIGEVVEENLTKLKEIYTFAFNPKTLRVERYPITGVYKHKCQDHFLKIQMEYGREINVTEHHSIFTIDNANIIPVKGKDLQVGDYVVVPSKISYESEMDSLNMIDLVVRNSSDPTKWYVRNVKEVLSQEQIEKLRKLDKSANQHLYFNSIPLKIFIKLDIDPKYYKQLRLGMARDPYEIPAQIQITEDLLFLLGIYVAEGSGSYKKFNISFGSIRHDLIMETKESFHSIFRYILKERHPYETEFQLSLDSELFRDLFEDVFKIGHGAYNKRIPFFVFKLKENYVRSFIRGYFLRDGHCRSTELTKKRIRNSVTAKTASDLLKEDINFLLLKIGIVPSISRDKDINIISIYGKIYLDNFLLCFKQGDLNWRSEDTQYTLSSIPLLVPTNHFGLKHNIGSAPELNHIERDSINQKQRIGREKLRKILPKLTQSNYKEQLKKFLDSDLTVLRIKKIDVLPKEEFAYDFEVKPNGEPIENFIAGTGLIFAHNSGGQGYDNFTVFMAPYLKGATYEDAKQLAQCFLYETNQIYAARGAQVPFTSISCLPTVPKSLMDVPAISFGGKYDGIYGDYIDECNMFFRALSEVYYQGDGTGKLFNFPKHEIKLKKEWLKEFEDEYLLISKEASKFGLPYYLNMVADWMPDEVHSQCCRIILTPEGIRKVCHDPDIFDWHKSYMNMGSLQSISLNLPRYAYQAHGDDDRLFEFIDHNLELARSILFIKQQVIEKAMKNNLIPICASKLDGVPLLDFRKQSLSIGFVGLNECVLAHTGYELHENPGSYTFGKKILEHLSEKCEQFTNETLLTSTKEKPGVKFSLWEQPAESLKSDELVLLYNEDTHLFGLTEISKALVNENISTFGFDKNNQPKIMNVEKLIKHPKRETFEIRTQHGLISVTNSHSLFSVDEELNIVDVAGKDVKIGTPLLMSREINVPENNLPLDLNGCCECLVENGVHFVKQAVTKAYRFIEKTYELGYILGHYIAEGTMKGVTITCGNDKSEMEKVAKLVKEIFGLPATLGKIHQERYLPVYNVTSRSKLANNIFTKGIGLEPVLSISKEIPPFLYNAPIECIKGFLAGIIIGDGSISDYTKKDSPRRDVYVRIWTSSKKLVFGINFLLKRLGIIARISKREFDQDENPNWHDAYELRIVGKKNLELLREFISEIPDVSGRDTSPTIDLNPWMKRLNDELKDQHGTSLRKLVTAGLIPFVAAKCAQPTYNRNISESALLKTLEALLELNYITPTGSKLYQLFMKNTLTKVLSIEEEKTMDHVYDLSVPENENFIAGIGQIYAHNSTAERFAKLDLKHYPKEAIPLGDRNTRSVYYTNSDHLNYAADISLYDRIEKQAQFHPIVQGGVITHVWMGEAYPDPEGLWKFTKAIAHTPTAYFAFTKDFTQCLKCLKFINGIHHTCPHCGAGDEYIEWWSRVTGYYSRVKRFNQGKFQEWHDRKRYNVVTNV